MKFLMMPLSSLALLIGTLSFAQTVATPAVDPACSVYVHLSYPHFYGKVVQKLGEQGFKLVDKEEDAYFKVTNYRCGNSGCAPTEAVLSRGTNTPNAWDVVHVRGYDRVQIWFSRAIVANNITLKLIEAMPTCEQAKTMPTQFIDMDHLL